VTPRSLWTRIAAAAALAIALGLALSPPRPPARLGPAPGAAIGSAAGLALFAAAARRRPRLSAAGPSAGAHLVLGALAASEEVVWRRILLGELLRAGPVAALALSSLAFALAHRRGRRLHAVTGLAFGGLYLGTGALAASLAAHWVYNGLVASLVARVPP